MTLSDYSLVHKKKFISIGVCADTFRKRQSWNLSLKWHIFSHLQEFKISFFLLVFKIHARNFAVLLQAVGRLKQCITFYRPPFWIQDVDSKWRQKIVFQKYFDWQP